MSVTQPASERVPGLAIALRRLAAVVAVLIAVATVLVVANQGDEPATAAATASAPQTDQARLADAARWQGLADYYLGRPGAATAAAGGVTSAQPGVVGGVPVAPSDPARLADAARWQGLADYYVGRLGAATAAAGGVTSAQPGTVGGVPIAPNAAADNSAARTEIWDFKDGFTEPFGAATPPGSTVDTWSYTTFMQRMLGIGAPTASTDGSTLTGSIGDALSYTPFMQRMLGIGAPIASTTPGDSPCLPSSSIC